MRERHLHDSRLTAALNRNHHSDLAVHRLARDLAAPLRGAPGDQPRQVTDPSAAGVPLPGDGDVDERPGTVNIAETLGRPHRARLDGTGPPPERVADLVTSENG